MKFRVFVEPQQGATYGDQLAIAVAAEELGYDGFFRSDHYLAVDGGLGEPGPTDSWVTLAGLARETRTLRLGTLVSSATFRHPGPLAIQVAQVDEMSAGRVELGLGTGWYEAEHAAYGIPFPPRRFGILEEQIQIVRGLWSTPRGERFDFAGKHYTLTGAPALPKPRQATVPLILGGTGPVRTPMLAARYADEFNVGFVRPAVAAEQYSRVAQACALSGRDPAEIVRSVALVVCCGTSDAQVAERARRIGRGVAALRATGLAGTPSEVVDRVAAYRGAGVQRIYMQFLDLTDFDHVELVAQQVLPSVSEPDV